MKYLTFDLEVENYKSNKRLASPFDPRNYVVEAGWSWNGGKVESVRFDEWHRSNVMDAQFDMLEKGDVINGFNIKFDLLWVWHQASLQNALRRGVIIYCGQYAEYLLGGQVQDVQMASMNDTAEQYGGGCKIDAVKEMWEEGYLTSEIPPDLLHDYLCGDGKEIVGDVHNTWLIMVGQIKRMKKDHPAAFRKMFKLRMDGLLATTEMEFNGVQCDKIIGEALRADLVERLAAAKAELEAYIPELPKGLVFNWGSPLHKSALIFGGTVGYSTWEQHVIDGVAQYVKKTEKHPIFDMPLLTDRLIENEDGTETIVHAGTLEETVIDPRECRVANGIHLLPVPESIGTLHHKGKSYLVQKVFQSGKSKGIGKTKNVQVPDYTKPKGAKQDKYFTFERITKPDPKWMGKQTDAYGEPTWSVSADVVTELGKRKLGFTNALRQNALIDKDLSTYYWSENKKGVKKGMLTLVGDDGILHHKLNHTSTVTSRLSSSDPNLQVLPRADEDDDGVAKSEVKRMFSSRFGEKEGRMVEIDYSQLEVVVQGLLSGDAQLTQDLQDKIDFHCKRLSAVKHEPYEDIVRKAKVEKLSDYVAGRTKAKRFSFQRAYGAGAKGISESTGIPRDEVDQLIVAEEKLYPTVVTFDQYIEKCINASRVDSGRKLFINGVVFTQGEGHWDSPTGTRYKWREDVTPEFMHSKGKYVGFSPTERKNYPVQGTGGEIVQAMIGKAWRYLLENNNFGGNVLLVNTVHDCVWLDGRTGYVEDAAREIQRILESVPELYNETFEDLNVVVPFPCETEIGNDMFRMEHL